jgi:putative endonuclease
MHQEGCFYIMTNTHNTVLYCGATNNLYRRIAEHKNGMYTDSFTSRYNICKLVYFEAFTFLHDAFLREKQIKGGSRKKKIELIRKINPEWKDLFGQLHSEQGEELIKLKKFFKQ